MGKCWFTADLVVTLGFLALFVWAIQQARGWPFRAALFPVLTASIVLGLILLKLAQDVSSARRRPPVARAEWLEGDQDSVEAELDDVFKAAPRPVWLAALGWMAMFFSMLWALGIFLAVPLFAFLYLRLASRESPLMSGAYAAFSWAFVFGLFDKVLHIPLPSGALLGAVGL